MPTYYTDSNLKCPFSQKRTPRISFTLVVCAIKPFLCLFISSVLSYNYIIASYSWELPQRSFRIIIAFCRWRNWGPRDEVPCPRSLSLSTAEFNENLGFLSACVILLPLYHVALIHISVISRFPLWQSAFLKPMIFKPFKKGSSNVLHHMYTGKKQLLRSWAAVGIEELETHHIKNPLIFCPHPGQSLRQIQETQHIRKSVSNSLTCAQGKPPYIYLHRGRDFSPMGFHRLGFIHLKNLRSRTHRTVLSPARTKLGPSWPSFSKFC